jgi:hypothetical protein
VCKSGLLDFQVYDPNESPGKMASDEIFHPDSLVVGVNVFENLGYRVMSEAFLLDDQVVLVDGIFDSNSYWLY